MHSPFVTYLQFEHTELEHEKMRAFLEPRLWLPWSILVLTVNSCWQTMTTKDKCTVICCNPAGLL